MRRRKRSRACAKRMNHRGDVNVFYPAMNWIAAQLALEGGIAGSGSAGR